MGDLSDYEKARLENIRRNNNFLEQLGFSIDKRPFTPKQRPVITDDKNEAEHKLKKKRVLEKVELPTRRSPRLHQEEVQSADDICNGVVGNYQEEGSDHIDYDVMPFDSNELDDFEFEVFVALKAWRLMKSRELDLEPYKIAQNRTLAELVRRKRNNENWGRSSLLENEISKDLLECWGIGMAKAKPGNFGWELNDVINGNPELQIHLHKSRQQFS